jgi:hypothetical protein
LTLAAFVDRRLALHFIAPVFAVLDLGPAALAGTYRLVRRFARMPSTLEGPELRTDRGLRHPTSVVSGPSRKKASPTNETVLEANPCR